MDLIHQGKNQGMDQIHKGKNQGMDQSSMNNNRIVILRPIVMIVDNLCIYIYESNEFYTYTL
jgi:hypothetical protein